MISLSCESSYMWECMLPTMCLQTARPHEHDSIVHFYTLHAMYTVNGNVLLHNLPQTPPHSIHNSWALSLSCHALANDPSSCKKSTANL